MSSLLEGRCDNCENTYEIYDLEQIAGTNFIICENCYKKYISEVEE